jgi:hypothetical protein
MRSGLAAVGGAALMPVPGGWCSMAQVSATIRSGPGIVKPLSQREAAMKIRRVPLLVILLVVLAQHAGVMMLAGK